ncbi:MAG TPA: GNAT family N-acetyltransferase [Thermoanaerobaculia bacterium]|nr:GNAT family N-acetyltransferase [Thermoanaerobaculia bacterium]
MRGLRLYVRPIDPADSSAVSAFLARQEAGPAEAAPSVPAWGLLGKLLGDIVAVVALEVTDDALRVDALVVARELRRKRIGRAMLREVEQLAAKLDRRRVVVDDAGGTQEFFRRVGFENEGERWAKNV